MTSSDYEVGCFVVQLGEGSSWEDLLLYSHAAQVLEKGLRAIDANDPFCDVQREGLTALAHLLMQVQSTQLVELSKVAESWVFLLGGEQRVVATTPLTGQGFVQVVLQTIPQAIRSLLLHLTEGNAPFPDKEMTIAFAELMNFHLWLQKGQKGDWQPLVSTQKMLRDRYPPQDSS